MSMLRHRGSRTAAALVALALSAGCTGGDPRSGAPESAGQGARTPAARTALDVDRLRHAVAERIMTRRETAVRTKDRAGFLADLDPANRPLLERQRRLFANLVQLPLQTFTLEALDVSWPSDFADARHRGTAYIPYVQQRLQLRGFDTKPVRTTYGLTLAPVRGRWRIVSDDDVAGREGEGARDAPWDLTRVVVRRSAHALGIFDARSAGEADRLMAWTERSIRDVERRVPVRWHGTVVVYALSSARLLRRMGTRYLDRAAVAFPVYDDNRTPSRLVDTRVVINPRYLPRTEFQGTYLLSHEVTHVALARSGRTPTWVQEGLAEYVATHGADRSWWRPTAESVARARQGATAMPGSTFFGDKDPAFEYDLSLAACAYLADAFGERRLWAFLTRLAAAARTDGDAEAHTDRVLRSMFGIGTRTLAGRAAQLVVQRGG